MEKRQPGLLKVGRDFQSNAKQGANVTKANHPPEGRMRMRSPGISVMGWCTCKMILVRFVLDCEILKSLSI